MYQGARFVPISEVQDQKAFRTDPVLTLRDREFSFRQARWPFWLTLSGVIIFGLCFAGVFYAMIRDFPSASWGERAAIAFSALIIGLIFYALLRQILDPRLRASWSEGAGERRQSLISEYRGLDTQRHDPDEVWALFKSQQTLNYLKDLKSYPSSDDVHLGFYLQGKRFEVYISMWHPTEDGAWVWPLLATDDYHVKAWVRNMANLTD